MAQQHAFTPALPTPEPGASACPYFVEITADSRCDPAFPPGCLAFVEPGLTPTVGRFLVLHDNGHFHVRRATAQDIAEPPPGYLGVATRRQFVLDLTEVHHATPEPGAPARPFVPPSQDQLAAVQVYRLPTHPARSRTENASAAYLKGVLDAQSFVGELHALHVQNIKAYQECCIETFLPILKAGLTRTFDSDERETGFWQAFAFWIEQGSIEGYIADPDKWDAVADLHEFAQIKGEVSHG